MPIITIEKLKAEIALDMYSAFTVDTNLFKKYAFKFEKTPLIEVGQRYPWIKQVMPSILRDEILKKFYEDIKSAHKDSIDKLGRFPEVLHFSECVVKLEELDVKNYCEDTVTSYFDNATEILDSSKVNLTGILYDYFNSNPPFDGGKKKAEFPDAIALNTLEEYARNNDINIIIISKDNDWINYCYSSSYLFAIESANDDILRECMFAFKNHEKAEIEIVEKFKTHVSNIDDHLNEQIKDCINEFFDDFDNIHCDADSPMSHDLEYSHTEIKYIDFKNSEWSIIQKSHEKLHFQGLISVDVSFYADITLSVWDSIDKEYIDIENKTISTDMTISIDISATLGIDENEINWDGFIENNINNGTIYVEFGYIEYGYN